MSESKKNGELRLVVVGSIGIDTIETPFEKREDVLGGSVSYACGAASLFAPVGMVGVVGDDFPGAFRAVYRELGIDLAGLQTEAGRTFRWSGVYDADMINRRTISTELNVFEHFAPRLPDAYRHAPFLLLGNISPELQLHVLSEARNPRFVVADTMDLWINVAREPLLELLGKVDMLMLNDAEARLLADRYNLRDCAEAIRSVGPRFVAIKKGEHGAMLFGDDGIFLVPAFPVGAVSDPTGAGDAFAGGFLGRLAECGDVGFAEMREALLYGAVVASFGVEEFSLDRLRRLTRAEVEERFEELRRMMQLRP